MSYYKEQLKAYRYIDKVMTKNPKVDVAKLVYEVTLNFEVSEKKVLKRIQLIQDSM